MALSSNACTNILRLLASDNERNAALALQLLDSQQARQDFLATLGAHLLTTDGEALSRIKGYLQALAKAIGFHSGLHARPLQLLQDFGKGNNPEAETEKAIQSLHQLFELDPLMLALYTYHQKGLCGSIILSEGSPSDIRRLMESRFFQSRRGWSMGMQGLKMEHLPEGLGAFEEIEVLDISNNRMARLPSSLLRFPGLRHLNVQYNAIRQFPKFLLASPTLECMDLRNNPLQMSWLEYLQHPHKQRFRVSLRNENGFSLNELHPEDTTLVLDNLAYESEHGLVLGLGNQQLREVPDAVFQLRKLQILDLRNNPLPMLPAWLLRMPELTTIYCDYGTEYNPGFKQASLEVLRDSQTVLPPPLAELPGRLANQPCPIQLPLELDVEGNV